MEVEVKPRYVPAPNEFEPQNGANSLPEAAPKVASGDGQIGEPGAGFWDSVYKYKTIIFISIIVTVLVCCVIYYMWREPERAAAGGNGNNNVANNGNNSANNITNNANNNNNTNNNNVAKNINVATGQPQQSQAPQMTQQQYYQYQQQQILQQQMMQQAAQQQAQAQSPAQAPKIVQSDIIEMIAIPIDINDIISRTSELINSGAVPQSENEPRVTEVTSEEVTQIQPPQTQTQIQTQIQTQTQTQPQPQNETVEITESPHEENTAAEAATVVESAIDSAIAPPQTQQCVFVFKTGKKCLKPTTGGKTFCARHI